jgi:putative salt-induced outer membrane protein
MEGSVRNVVLLMVLGSTVTLAANAEDASWKGKGEAGIVFARGNTDTDTINLRLGMSHEADLWKHGFDIGALRAATNGDKTAQRYFAGWQSDRKLTDHSYWFGGLRYENDKFSGFDYQASATTGYGYKFIDNASTKFFGQAGVGYRRLQNSLTGVTKGDAIFRGDLGLDHALTDTSKVVDRFFVEAGSSNTLASNEISLVVKMNDALSLAAGLAARYNTKPPLGIKKTDTLTTLNLVRTF